MQNYKKTILAVAVLAMLPLLVAAETEDKTIYVNTLADEDGENLNACSLREAITAAAQNKPYGGCSAGKTYSSVVDVIQLEAGTYKLTKPLYPSSQVNIYGQTSTNWDEKDPITNDYPKRTALKTIIEGNGTFGLIDTTQGNASLSLINLRLTQGKAIRGGAVKSGGALNLDRVEIDHVSAQESGGAIYLAGANSVLAMNNSVIRSATAENGAAVLGMSCVDNLQFTSRTLTMTNSSIVGNGAANNPTIMEFCGAPTVEFTANTIAHNTINMAKQSTVTVGGVTNVVHNAILKFTGDSEPNTQANSILSAQSGLKLVSNTIVNNTGFTTFLYDSIGSKSLSYNILAYNKGDAKGGSCQHLLGGVASGQTAGLTLYANGLIRSPAAEDKGFCDVPYFALSDQSSKDLSAISQSSVMVDKTAEADVGAYTAFMPMYFLTNAKTSPLVDLKEQNATGCSSVDQRSVTRLVDSILLLDKDTKNTCDIGSTELVKLAASDIVSINSSQVAMVSGFESQRDFFQNLLDDKNTRKEFLKYYEIRRDEFKEKLETYQKPENLKYRQAYIDILKNSIPQESSDNDHTIQFLDTGLYNITAEAIGTGQDIMASGVSGNLPTNPDPNLVCEWKPEIKQLVMYRLDGAKSASGDYHYCKYTISLKSDPEIKSTGLVQATFVNIAPIAKDDSYTLDWGTDQRVKLDVLANDHDDGDGSAKQSNYPEGKNPFCNVLVNSKWDSICKDDPLSVPAPIKLGAIDTNLILEAQYSAPCPDNTRTICYGGDIYVKPKNNFNKFNYSFTYQVFDADGELSEPATVKLVNTATTSEDTRSGGGSLGWLSVFGLLGLAAYRRRKMP